MGAELDHTFYYPHSYLEFDTVEYCKRNFLMYVRYLCVVEKINIGIDGLF